MKNIIIPILLISLLLTGCSSKQQTADVPLDSENISDTQEEITIDTTDTAKSNVTTKKYTDPFSNIDKDKIIEILNKHLTDEDWANIKQGKNKYGIDSGDTPKFISDILAVIMTFEIIENKPELKKELDDYLRKSLFIDAITRKMLEEHKSRKFK